MVSHVYFEPYSYSWVILREPASVKLMLLSGLAVIGVVMVTVSGEDDSDGSHLGDFLVSASWFKMVFH
jgi:drug/metabolite transporter (DMT)-like permease